MLLVKRDLSVLLCMCVCVSVITCLCIIRTGDSRVLAVAVPVLERSRELAFAANRAFRSGITCSKPDPHSASCESTQSRLHVVSITQSCAWSCTHWFNSGRDSISVKCNSSAVGSGSTDSSGGVVVLVIALSVVLVVPMTAAH